MRMKSLIVLMLTLGLMVIGAGAAMAAFTQVQSSTSTAVAVITAAATGTMTVQVRGLDGTTVGTDITWNSTAITPGTTKWLCAERLLYVNCTYTAGGIQIYTDNTETDAVPQWAGVGDPKNLLRDVGLSTSTAGIPLCWRTPWGLLDTPSKREIYNVENILVSGEWHLADAIGSQYFNWIRMTDKGASGFVEGSTGQTIWMKDQGCQHAEYTFDTGCKLEYVYIGADFTDAMAASTYKTTTLRLELYSL